MNIPYEVYQLLAILKDYKPLLVGRCVRDHLIGNKPYDLVVPHVHHQMQLEIIEAGWQIIRSYTFNQSSFYLSNV